MSMPSKNIAGHYYPEFHCGWGGCAEELFHYTSRYYTYTEAFLRNLAYRRDFSMIGYRASCLSEEQRALMAAVLTCRPEQRSAKTVIEIIAAVRNGKTRINASMKFAYRKQLNLIPGDAHLTFSDYRCKPDHGDVMPLDPFLSMAERLRLPVAVKEHHVEVSLRALAKHLDSSNPRVRENLQEAVLRLHNARYLLRNHPHLTHGEAKFIADEGSV